MTWAFHLRRKCIPFDYCYLFGIFGKLKIIVMRIICGKNAGDLVGFLSGTIA